MLKQIIKENQKESIARKALVKMSLITMAIGSISGCALYDAITNTSIVERPVGQLSIDRENYSLGEKIRVSGKVNQVGEIISINASTKISNDKIYNVFVTAKMRVKIIGSTPEQGGNIATVSLEYSPEEAGEFDFIGESGRPEAKAFVH